MRELSVEELELVSGGENNEDVVVIGYPPYYPPPPGSYPGAYGYAPPSPSTPPYAGSGGGSTNTMDRVVDAAVDKISIDIANQIKAIPNHDSYEYGAWIYKDKDGNIKQSNVLPGPDWGTSPFGKSLQEFGVPDGATLLGQIHNHPTYNPEGQTLSGRGNPDNYDLNAISGSAGYAQPGHSISVDSNNFRGYIYHDNVVDEYDRATHQTTYDTSRGIEEKPGVAKDSTTSL